MSEHGADGTIQDEAGNTLIHEIKDTNILNLFIDYNYDITVKNKNGLSLKNVLTEEFNKVTSEMLKLKNTRETNLHLKNKIATHENRKRICCFCIVCIDCCNTNVRLCNLLSSLCGRQKSSTIKEEAKEIVPFLQQRATVKSVCK